MSDIPLHELFSKILNTAGLNLTASQIDAFLMYTDILRDWNTRINLTAIVDDEGIVIRHFLDSLSILSAVDAERARVAPKPLSLIDVGTGAGFPGLPIRIVRPDLQLTLLDSLQKRIAFLDTVVHDLALFNVKTLKARAEDVGLDPKYREHFDIVTARAVAPMPVLCEYTLPFVRIGGLLIAMKGQKKEEIEEASFATRTLGGRIESIDTFVLPGSDLTRTLVLIRKIAETPPCYPRKAGLPERHPLI